MSEEEKRMKKIAIEISALVHDCKNLAKVGAWAEAGKIVDEICEKWLEWHTTENFFALETKFFENKAEIIERIIKATKFTKVRISKLLILFETDKLKIQENKNGHC